MTVIKSNPSLPFNLIDNLITLLLCTTLLRCHIISNDTPVTESNSWPKVIRVPLKIVHGSYQCFHGWKVFELSVWCLRRSEFLCNVDSRIQQWESDAAWLHTKQSLVEFSCYLTLLFYKRSPYRCTLPLVNFFQFIKTWTPQISVNVFAAHLMIQFVVFWRDCLALSHCFQVYGRNPWCQTWLLSSKHNVSHIVTPFDVLEL